MYISYVNTATVTTVPSEARPNQIDCLIMALTGNLLNGRNLSECVTTLGVGEVNTVELLYLN